MQILLTIYKNLPHKIHKGKPCTRKVFIEEEQILKINETKTHLRTDSRQGLSEKPVKTVRNPAGQKRVKIRPSRVYTVYRGTCLGQPNALSNNSRLKGLAALNKTILTMYHSQG